MAVSTWRCHARYRIHMCPVSRVNSSFSRVNNRKRRVKGASGHSLRHTLLTLVFRVLSEIVNMVLGALREQQQLRKGCFVGKLFIFEGSEPQKTRETRSRAQSPAQPHQIGLHGPDCNSKYAVGIPARPAAAVGELFSKNVRAQEALERYSPPKTAQTAQCESPESSLACNHVSAGNTPREGV